MCALFDLHLHLRITLDRAMLAVFVLFIITSADLRNTFLNDFETEDLQFNSQSPTTMARPISYYGIEEALSPSDREDFSIFLLYPEIESDSIDNSPSAFPSVALLPSHKDEAKFSPLSTTITVFDSSVSSRTKTHVANTSCQTSTRKECLEIGGWNEFIHLMQRSDLPQECLHYFTSLGQTILNIGTILHSTLRPNQPSNVLRIGRWLLKSVKCSSRQVAKQVQTISDLSSSLAFKVNPEEMQLWSTYRQRARMIAKY